MSDSNNNKQPAAAQPRDAVRVRVLRRLLLERTFTNNGRAREVLTERWANPGEVIELPKAEAERLATRAFEGYPTMHDIGWKKDSRTGQVTVVGGTTCAPFPAEDGLVHDPIVEILAA